MVLIEHVGFGGREREIWLYFWDARDGPDWSGWWITPDFIGNNEFFYQAQGPDGATPDAVPVGAWRSPNVEELQLKRKLEIGFKVDGSTGGSSRTLVAVGADAATPIIPDGASRVDLSNYAFVEAGINHGRPCYKAQERPKSETSSAAETSGAIFGDGNTRLMLGVALGVCMGILGALGVQRLTARR